MGMGGLNWLMFVVDFVGGMCYDKELSRKGIGDGIDQG